MNFKRDKEDKDEIIKNLQHQIEYLNEELIKAASANGNLIVKQLPNGQVELNGEVIDNTTEVEYYNSSQATYGELTMFRIGKEFKQREINKLVNMHMDEIDELNLKISHLEQDNAMLNGKSTIDNDTIKMHEKREQDLESEIIALKKQNEADKELAIHELNETKQTYESMITHLESDIKLWKERYLLKNNIQIDGTIITTHGKLLGL